MLSSGTCSQVDVDLLCDKVRDLHRKVHRRSTDLIDNCRKQHNFRLAVACDKRRKSGAAH